MLKLVFSVLNPNHYNQNIGLIKYCILCKVCLKDIKRLLATMLRYFVGLSVFCFPKTNTNIQRSRTFLSFCLGIDYDEFVMNAFGSRWKSVGQLQKYGARTKLFILQLDLLFLYFTRLQIIPIAVENRGKKKVHGNPLRILNLPFQHSHNSLRVYCAS